MGEFILQSLWLLLPMGVANMSPVFVKKLGKWSDLRVDFGATLGGKPLFGSHKTWRGMIAGTLVGGLVWWGQVWLLNNTDIINKWYLFDYNDFPIWVGFLLGFGAIFGDLIKSFFKRRVGVKSGDKWIPFDQIDYMVGGLAIGSIVLPIPVMSWVVIIAFGFFFHFFFNWLGFKFKLKDNPW